MLSEDEKNPSIVFKEVAFHYLNDQEREKKKIDFSELIEKYFKVVEKEFETLVENSVDKQKLFHEKYNNF